MDSLFLDQVNPFFRRIENLSAELVLWLVLGKNEQRIRQLFRGIDIRHTAL